MKATCTESDRKLCRSWQLRGSKFDLSIEERG